MATNLRCIVQIQLRGEFRYPIACRGCGKPVGYAPTREYAQLEAHCTKCQQRTASSTRRKRANEFQKKQRLLIDLSQFHHKPATL
jgi:hypothetical protein